MESVQAFEQVDAEAALSRRSSFNTRPQEAMLDADTANFGSVSEYRQSAGLVRSSEIEGKSVRTDLGARS